MIRKNYSAKRIAQEIADAIVENYECGKTWITPSLSATNGVAKEFKKAISPLRTEVIRQVKILVSDKTNATWDLIINTDEPYPGEFELKIDCQLIYQLD